MARSLAVLCLLLAGCAAPLAPTSGVGPADSPSPLPSHCSPRPTAWPSPSMYRGDKTHDDQFADVGDRVPEFAGLSVDESRKAVLVRVTDGRDETARRAIEAYRSVTGSDQFAGHEVIAVKVAYSWHQLKTWYDTANQAGAWAGGVTMSDIQETRNRIEYGATDPDAIRDCIAAVMAHYGVPDDAWHLEQQDAATVGDAVLLHTASPR